VFERPRTGERAVLVRLGLGAHVDPEDLHELLSGRQLYTREEAKGSPSVPPNAGTTFDVNVFASLGEHRLAIEVGREFRASHVRNIIMFINNEQNNCSNDRSTARLVPSDHGTGAKRFSLLEARR